LSYSSFLLNEETIYYFANEEGFESFTFYLQPIVVENPNLIYNLVLMQNAQEEWQSIIFELHQQLYLIK